MPLQKLERTLAVDGMRAHKPFDLAPIADAQAGLIQVPELISTLEAKPAHMHLVLTGRNAHRRIIQLADLVTDMKQVKHPFGSGVRAQIGIEY